MEGCRWQKYLLYPVSHYQKISPEEICCPIFIFLFFISSNLKIFRKVLLKTDKISSIAQKGGSDIRLNIFFPTNLWERSDSKDQVVYPEIFVIINFTVMVLFE